MIALLGELAAEGPGGNQGWRGGRLVPRGAFPPARPHRLGRSCNIADGRIWRGRAAGSRSGERDLNRAPRERSAGASGVVRRRRFRVGLRTGRGMADQTGRAGSAVTTRLQPPYHPALRGAGVLRPCPLYRRRRGARRSHPPTPWLRSRPPSSRTRARREPVRGEPRRTPPERMGLGAGGTTSSGIFLQRPWAAAGCTMLCLSDDGFAAVRPMTTQLRDDRSVLWIDPRVSCTFPGVAGAVACSRPALYSSPPVLSDRGWGAGAQAPSDALRTSGYRGSCLGLLSTSFDCCWTQWRWRD